MSTQILLWALEAQAGSCPVRKTRPSARLQRIPRASSPVIPSVFDWPNTGWNGFTLALLSDGNQPNPPRRKMLSRLNASNNWVHEGCGERLCCRCRGSRFGAPQIRTVPRAEECETRYPCYRHAQYVHRLALSPDVLPATSESLSSSSGSLSSSRGYLETERCGEVLMLRDK